MSAYRSFAVRVTGGSHIKHGKDCQDAVSQYEDARASIAVVADGHGDDNCFRSAKGSDFAVKCATLGIYEFVKFHESKFKPGLFGRKNVPPQDEFDRAIRDIVKRIIASWQIEVANDHEKNPFTPEELEKADEKHRKRFEAGKGLNKAYGSTLIAAAVTPHYWFGFHIGDGRLTALYPDGTYDQPVPWDEKCYLNVTTSICDDDAFEQARCYFAQHSEKQPPAAVFLCTDGVDDNYPVEGNEKHLFKLYRTIALTFAEDGFDNTCKQLKDLASGYATRGKGDDTSIAGFIDMEAVKQAVPVWKEQIAEEEAAAVKPAEKESPAAGEAEAEPETGSPKSPAARGALEAIAAYEKHMDLAKQEILDYGNFETGERKSGKE